MPDSRWRSCTVVQQFAVAELHISSVVAMGKNIMAAFRPVRFEYGNIHMVGGYCTKPVAMKSKTVDTANGTTKTFVKLSGRDAWLLTATTGSCRTNGSSFHRTSLLGDLRVHINRICDAGIGDIVDNPIESDPMLELAENPGAICVGRPAKYHTTKHAKVQRWRYPANIAKNCISTFDMPFEALKSTRPAQSYAP